jgi:hypothetical protein
VPPAGGQERAARASKPVRAPQGEEEEQDVLDARLLDAEPEQNRGKRAAGAGKARSQDQLWDGEDQHEPREPEELPRSKRRKRKRRRPQIPSKESTFLYDYMGWIIASAVYAFVASSIVGCMLATGHFLQLMIGGISWAIMMVVSVVILVASMFISSAIAGGIDYGDATEAIPKAIFLLAPINLLCILTLKLSIFFGFFLLLPVWAFGLMWLYHLDFWEARFLIFINSLLNRGASFLLLLAITSMLQRDLPLDFDEGLPANARELMVETPEEAVDPPWTAQDIREMRGSLEQDTNAPGQPVVSVSLRGIPIEDDQVYRLSGFHNLVRLDLGDTNVTDLGFMQLIMFRKLQAVTAPARVTDQAIRVVEQAIPGVKVTR